MNKSDKNNDSDTKSRNRYISLVVFVFGLFIFAISHLFEGDITLISKQFINGNEFEINGNRYTVNKNFIIFEENENAAHLIKDDSNKLVSIMVTELISNYFIMLVESKNIEIIDLGKGCKLYKRFDEETNAVSFAWVDEKKRILLEVFDGTLVTELESICKAVKPIVIENASVKTISPSQRISRVS